MIRLLLAGSHQYTVECYRHIRLLREVEVVGFVPNQTTPLKFERKQSNKAFRFQVPEEFEDLPSVDMDALANAGADMLLSVMYNRILRDDQIAAFPKGCWNLHPGLLPEYRGRNILYWTIMNSEQEQGITFHELVAELDAGRILRRMTYPVREDDTAESLFIRIRELIGSFSAECVSQIVSEDYELQPNDIENGCLYTADSVDYSNLHFTAECLGEYQQVERLFRALMFPSLNQYPALKKGDKVHETRSVEDIRGLKVHFGR